MVKWRTRLEEIQREQ